LQNHEATLAVISTFDMRSALRARYFANQRIEEITANERAQNAFEIFGADIVVKDDRMVAKIAVTMADDGSTKVFEIILESRDDREKFDGQAQFQYLLSAFSMRQIEDVGDLIGKEATFNICDGFRSDARLPFFFPVGR
jgi:hypothetical protein